MNLQHKLAELLVLPLQDGRESAEEHALLVYGIEIFLNEFIKVIIIFLFAALVGEVKIATIGTCYLLLARRCSGGRHFNSNAACTLFTIFTAFVGPLGVSFLQLPLWLQMGIGILETGGMYKFVPYTEENSLNASQRKRRKISAILLFWSFMGIAGLLVGKGLINGIFFKEIIVILAVVKYKDR